MQRIDGLSIFFLLRFVCVDVTSADKGVLSQQAGLQELVTAFYSHRGERFASLPLACLKSAVFDAEVCH